MTEDVFKLPPPGMKIDGELVGPCSNSRCGHVSCVDTRLQAEYPCEICGKVIGYDNPFYYEVATDEAERPVLNLAGNAKITLVHAECRDEEEEDEEPR